MTTKLPITDKPLFKTLLEAEDDYVTKVCANTFWGRLLGEGIAPDCSVLLGGEPGGGKSTVTLQIMKDLILATGKPALYISAEERSGRIKARAKRVGYPDELLSQVHIVEGADANLDILQSVEGGLCVAIVDSINGLVGEDEANQVLVARTVDRWTQRVLIPSFILTHVTKGGEFSGFMTIQHDVGTTVYLKDYPGKPRRTWTTRKNRFGPGQVVAELCMTELGLVPMRMNLKGDWVMDVEESPLLGDNSTIIGELGTGADLGDS
jgi:DNA repair protein RadA/Sms